MTKAIFDELEVGGDELLKVISSFSDDQIHIVPFEGSWTAAQVADHLLKADTGALKVLYGKTEKTERQADEKVRAIKNMFLDFSLKFKSSEQIMPSNFPQGKNNLLKDLKVKLTALQEAAETLDLSAICAEIEVPALGTLTRLEWLYLVCYHTQRHTCQIQNIFQNTANYNHHLTQKVS